MNLTIREIAESCGGKLVLQGAGEEAKVNGVVLDSRKVTVGNVFLATVGERVDGHKFIPEVFRKGASLVICEKTPCQVEKESGVPASDWGSYLLVENSFQALKEIAEYYRSKLSIPIVGITGSVGKTSTKEFIATVLGEHFQVLKTEGNYNNEIGVPLTLLRIGEEHEAAVIEMGISDFGEMHRLSKMVRPTVCVITNIGQCHLENLGTRDGILKAKTEIFDYMQEDAVVCLNGDDDKLSTVTEVKGRKPHFFGLGQGDNEEVYADQVVSKGLWGSEAKLHVRAADGTERTLDIEVPLPGVHMVANAAAAACVARALGLSEQEIVAGIAKVQAVGGRTHLIRLKEHTLIDDCYNANPVSMKAAIDLLAMAEPVRVAILGDMFELGEDSDSMHAEVGRHAAQAGLERILCVGEGSRQMYEAACLTALSATGSDTEAAAIEKSAADNDAPQIIYFPDREKLLEALADKSAELMPKGSTILVKASHGMGFAEVVEKLTKDILL